MSIINNLGVNSQQQYKMWRDQITNKRQKFANEIRKRQHQQHFEAMRIKSKQNVQAIAYLPILIENSAYDDIELIMDCFETSENVEKVDPKLFRVITENVRITMLKLMNRLRLWKQEHLQYALQLLKNGQQSMLKQLSYYFSVKMETHHQHQVQIDAQSARSEIQTIFEAVLHVKIGNMENRIFWLDIICNAVQLSPKCQARCQQNPEILVTLLEMSLQQNDASELPRTFNIISKVIACQQFQRALVNFGCFQKLIEYIKVCDISMVSTGLDIIGELLSGDESVIFKLVNNYNIIHLLQRYSQHTWIPLQLKALWGLSNIAGSQQYHTLLQKQELLKKLIGKGSPTTKIEVRAQADVLVCNLLCNCNGKQLQQLGNKYKIIQLLYAILDQISNESALKDKLFDVAMYAAYHSIIEYSHSFVVLQQLGIKKVVLRMYENEKHDDRLKKISTLLDLIEKQDTQPKTSTT